jgi:ABC-type glutathione transport system ATPase component
MSMLSVEGLRIAREDGTVIVDGVSFEVPLGASLGIIGESGSGKSLTLKALAGILPRGLEAIAGHARIGDDEISFPAEQRAAAAFARRAGTGMIFQDPSTALDPLLKIASQLGAVYRFRRGAQRRAWRQGVETLLDDVELDRDIAGRYPHELSGGQRQRVVIALALAARPAVLLCDEPTTALDVTVQARILELLDKLRVEHGLTTVFVSHDLAVVRALCPRVVVMQRGKVVEAGDFASIADDPTAEYTRMLVDTARALERPLTELRRP